MASKSDTSVKNIVTASIRRHSMDMDTWTLTRVWDSGDPDVVAQFEQACRFAQGELPIVYSYIDATTWTLVTTRHIWYASGGTAKAVSPADVERHDLGNFKGYGRTAVEHLRLICRDGTEHRCPYETGKPSMGIVYGVMTLCSVGPAA